MQIHFIVHEEFEQPGAYAVWAQLRGHKVSFSRLYSGDELPRDLSNIDFLIIMGGPQSPMTTIHECAYFDSAAEQALIVAAKNAGKAVLGVCLGAQLVGQALGGMVERSPEKEIGVFPLYLTPIGQSNLLTAHLGRELLVGHWHSDMPGLTDQAQVLAYSAGCPRQIICYAPLVYGFQCHMELMPEQVELLIQHSETDFNHADKYRYVQSAKQIRAQSYTFMNQKLYIFLDKFSQLIQAYSKSNI